MRKPDPEDLYFYLLSRLLFIVGGAGLLCVAARIGRALSLL